VYLARRGIDQVGAAYHIGDALFGVVHDHRKLVGEGAVGAIGHEIADLPLDRLRDGSLQPIVERDSFRHRFQSDRTRALSARESRAARSRIHPRTVGGYRGIRDLLPRTGAPVGGVHGRQPLQRLPIKIQPPALPDDLCVPMQPRCLELRQDPARGIGPHPRPVEVLDAQQPTAAGRPRIEPAREGGDERTKMQRTGG